MTDTTTVIVAGARTPMGRLLGSLKDLSGSDLGGIAIKGALDKSGVAPEQVEYVIMGQVLTAGAGQMPARQAAVAAGIPMTVPAPEHQQSVPVRHRRHRPRRPTHPRRRIRHRRRRRAGIDVPRTPQCSKKAAKVSNTATSPSATTWPTTASTTSSPTRPWACSPNKSTNKKPPTSPAPSRTPSPPPHTRTRPAPWKDGYFDNEVVPVSIPQRKGEPIVFAQDEGIRADTTTESLGTLRPAFSKDGTITAGSASPIS